MYPKTLGRKHKMSDVEDSDTSLLEVEDTSEYVERHQQEETPTDATNQEEPKVEDIVLEEDTPCFREIELKLRYDIADLFPRFQPFDRDDTAYLVANKMEAHRIWKNSLVKAYVAVLDKDEFLEQVMTIFFAFNSKRDSGRLAFEYHCFLSDIKKGKIIEKVTHQKMFVTTPDGSYTQAYLTANPLKGLVQAKRPKVTDSGGLVESGQNVVGQKAPRKPRAKTSAQKPKVAGKDDAVANIIGQKIIGEVKSTSGRAKKSRKQN